MIDIDDGEILRELHEERFSAVIALCAVRQMYALEGIAKSTAYLAEVFSHPLMFSSPEIVKPPAKEK